VSSGWFGEKKTQFSLWVSLKNDLYLRHHDVILPSKNGSAQIDHLVISPFGIFIVETKNLKGWIYGDATQSSWTQVIYRSKHKFQNPLRQTFRQKKVIAEFLGVREKHIHPLVAFVGKCKLKTDMPPNVISSGFGSYIKSFQQKVFTDEEVQRIQHLISNHVATSLVSTDDHIQSLRDRHSSTTICPRCGSNLVERTVKNGANAGSQFLGCEDYPRCRFTRDLPPVESGVRNGSSVGGFILKIILVFSGIAAIYLFFWTMTQR